MGLIQEKKNKQMQVVSAIRVLLENRGMDSDADWDKDKDSLRKLDPLANGKENYVIDSDSLGITQEEDQSKLIFAVLKRDESDFQRKLLDEVIKISEKSATKSIQLVFLVNSMSRRITIEVMYDKAALKKMKKDVKKAASEHSPSVKNKSLTLSVDFILLQDYVKQEIRLTELHSLDMFHEPPLYRRFNLDIPEGEPCDVRARVFTVDLYQLTKCYDLVGDSLFQNNVRFGIKEAMGVDKSIQDTLRGEPWQFWFKNNGVTILIKDSDASLQEARTLLLGKLDPKELPSFSVVNGAQTITAAARYFFELEYKVQKASPEGKHVYEEELERAKKCARVLVRVIHITSGSREEVEKRSRAISIALNRQKPIRIDDIAFTNPAVLKLAECLRRQDDPPFMLARQGESGDTSKRVELIAFARSRMGCIGRPGAARSDSRNKLLNTKTDEDGNAIFTCQGLFSEDWLEAEDESKEDKILKRDYGAVWFAHQTAVAYEKEMRRMDYSDQEILNVIKNGKWYFTATLTQILNNFRCISQNNKMPDFSGFSATVPENLSQLMESFAKLTVAVARGKKEGEVIASNLLKKEELYGCIIEIVQAYFNAEKTGADIQQPSEICEPLKTLMSQIEIPQVTLTRDRIGHNENYVILNDLRTDVATDAMALVKIAEYIMNRYPEKRNALLEECRGWLYRAEHVNSTQETFQVGEELFVIETNVNTPNKRSRMKKLCRFADISLGEVRWHKAGDPDFTFSS